ncbi:MAG TPA: tRNA (adenosine(37)-N6)-threonylcarbamoyltransferase complex transferase subunit TsaD, partial [Acidobacteriota bacterium]|nr:tRNA (adenosine(37)-N6)-threonylcarbamoyltransferase complex transferase subunit TsaD [Acidobacteriota bacterium]
PGIVTRAMELAGIGWDECAAVAVTAGPGLIGCLLVGVAYARAAARARAIPLLPINHLEGHAHTPALAEPDIAYPYLVLIASGGHSSLVVVESPGAFRCIGRTRDDAAGEAFDKVGKVLGYDYPAGPQLDRDGEGGSPNAVSFPIARFEGQGYDFSFSGVKTAAALDWAARQEGRSPEIKRVDWIASFEYAITEALCGNLFRAADDLSIDTVALAGGVACNRRLRHRVTQWAAQAGRRAVIPPPELCADNAAMIAAVGLYRYPGDGIPPELVDAVPGWALGDPLPRAVPQ